MKIAVIDYGIGNIKSNINALLHLGAKPYLTNKEKEILSCDGMILPGVGAFKAGMENLNKFNLHNSIKSFAIKDKPVLGICLGMQLLFSSSTEGGEIEGLNLIEGKVQKLPESKNEKIPSIGWKKLLIPQNNNLTNGLVDEDLFYFVHSFYCTPQNKEHTIASAKFGNMDYCAMVQNKNIFGCQFHPEKSRESGLNILNNFLKIV